MEWSHGDDPADIYFPEKIFSATEPADWPDPLHDKGTLYLKIEIARRGATTVADPQVVKVPLFTATPEEMQSMESGVRKYLDLVEERMPTTISTVTDTTNTR